MSKHVIIILIETILDGQDVAFRGAIDRPPRKTTQKPENNVIEHPSALADVFVSWCWRVHTSDTHTDVAKLFCDKDQANFLQKRF